MTTIPGTQKQSYLQYVISGQKVRSNQWPRWPKTLDNTTWPVANEIVCSNWFKSEL